MNSKDKKVLDEVVNEVMILFGLTPKKKKRFKDPNDLIVHRVGTGTERKNFRKKSNAKKYASINGLEVRRVVMDLEFCIAENCLPIFED